MKNFFKYVLVVIICFACMFIYNAFQTPTVVGITKGETNGLYDSYVVTYSDGTKTTITIKNGEDGTDAEDITIEDLYIATKTAKGYGDEYTLLDFVEEYLSFDVEQKDETKAYLGCLSTVVVYSEFPTSINYSTYETGSSMASGAGVIYQPNKDSSVYYIITNYHMIYSADSISTDRVADKVHCFLYGANVQISATSLRFGGYNYTYGDDAIELEYLGGSMKYDVAVLKVKDSTAITNSNARPITACLEDAVVGETVVAIGNPEGSGMSVTRGIVSVDSEYVTMTAPDNKTEITFRATRIDASVNGGNSGGGLYNTKGELLGIVNSKIVDEKIEGMAYALPAVTCLRLADNIIANASSSNKSPKKVVFGIELTVKSSSAVYNAENMSTKIVEKVCVSKITTSSICDGALSVGDEIVSILIDGNLYTIDRIYRLDDLSWFIKGNTVVVFNVMRTNINVTVPIAVESDDIQKVI